MESTTEGLASDGVMGCRSTRPRLVRSGPEEVVDLGVALGAGREMGGIRGCAKLASGVWTILGIALSGLPGLASAGLLLPENDFSVSEV